MAKRKAGQRKRGASGGRKRTAARRSAKRPTRKSVAKRAAPKKAAARRTVTRKPDAPRPAARRAAAKTPRLDRARRTLEEEMVPMPPSSLNMDRHGSAARTGRAEMKESLREHHGMNDVSGGDLDVDVEDAFFTGDEAPGGDNPTPDQDIVDDIGKSLGVQYDDNEELKGSEKVTERDRHRWELDPASSEDYKDRK